MIDFQAPAFLRRILLLDAATCIATGALMTLGATPLAALLLLPAGLLFYSGLSLLPIAAFIAFVATRQTISPAGVWLVIIGNAGWVLTSLALLTDQRLTPNTLGIGFILLQAAAVAVLAELEYAGLKRTGRTTTA
jgi:hypothetical protein